MTSVTFVQFDMNDDSDALTIEDVYRHWAGFAGIQSFRFDNLISGFDAAKWSAVANVSYANGNLARTGAIADTVAWYNDNLPHSYAFEFTARTVEWGAAVRGDGNNNYYKIRADSGYILIAKTVDGVDTYLIKRPLADNEKMTWGRVKISVRDEQFNSIATGRNVYISVWLNNQLLVAICDSVAYGTPPMKMGMIVPAGNATNPVYTDFRVGDLSELIVWSSLDPGENPLGAIQRAIEDRYIRTWIRWDGSLRAYHPRARANTLTLSTSREFNLTPTVDIRQIFTHLRVLGAFQWVQVMDADLVRMFGHRFKEINNTSLWNADDCERVGRNMLLRAKEQAFQAQFTTYGMLFAEPEDRIQLPNHKTAGQSIDYIIDGLEWTYHTGTFKCQIRARQYFYGEP